MSIGHTIPTHTLDLDSMMQINKNSPLCCALLSANTNISLFFVPVLQFCTWPPFVYIFSICRRKCGLEALLSQTQCPQSGWCPQKMVVVYTKEKCTQNSSSHQLLQCSFWCLVILKKVIRDPSVNLSVRPSAILSDFHSVSVRETS